MHRVKLPLSLLISAVLLGSTLLASSLIYFQEQRNLRDTITEQSIVGLNVLASQLQISLFTTLSQGYRDQASLTIAVAALTPGVRFVALVDDQDHVLHCSRAAWIGLPLGQVSTYDPGVAARLRATSLSKVEVVPGNEYRLRGYYPIQLDTLSREMVGKSALLYMEFDTRNAVLAAHDLAYRRAASTIALMVGLVLVVGVILHLMITRRVRRISKAATLLGSGELSVRAHVDGYDEIGHLGRSFDQMVESMATDARRRREAEEQVRRLALYDPLTNLPNRRFLADRIAEALRTSGSTRRHGALVMLDLDHFQKLNDSRGHALGDELLVDVALRLSMVAHTQDSVFRLGGDEFVVLAEGLDGRLETATEQAERIAARILEAFSRPFLLGGHEYHSSASIGVSLFCGEGNTMEVLLKQADVALYEAKERGRNTVRLYSTREQYALEGRLSMETALRRALINEEFRLYYQPQVDQDGNTVGAEALIRWFDPNRGLVMPASFIPLAEETGMIVDVGRWVIDAACRQLKSWERDARTRKLQISVNVSPRQFYRGEFVNEVRNSIARSGANPRLLKLELTEGIVLNDINYVVASMEALRDLGLRFSLDDFGTGYSSLAYLKRLPFEQVKIDQSFVRDLVQDPNDAAIVQAILAMSRSLGLEVIAEGVETPAQRDFLVARGCRYFQGYLFGRPTSIAEWKLEPQLVS